ncbi:hypothetical protein GUJ93_ZPchr0008g13197 [Zizania palustris]|uniref:Uncharacterized protein n=1 Tax=Zizania palustris TaxID=103762 RepID=A0A8J5RKN8_ZIZPA|nr:hypothetical protein GUJ93_ZPchr0008g13197 [Zizania palustris]
MCCIHLPSVTNSIFCLQFTQRTSCLIFVACIATRKVEERSAIIKQMGGQIVKMSQQKFVSNEVEKCLSFGTCDERRILTNEMLGTTDENEPLQVARITSSHQD